VRLRRLNKAVKKVNVTTKYKKAQNHDYSYC